MEVRNFDPLKQALHPFSEIGSHCFPQGYGPPSRHRVVQGTDRRATSEEAIDSNALKHIFHLPLEPDKQRAELVLHSTVHIPYSDTSTEPMSSLSWDTYTHVVLNTLDNIKLETHNILGGNTAQ